MFGETEARLLSFVSDYKINVIAPRNIRDEDFRRFRTDVGPLLHFIKNQRYKGKMDGIVHRDDRFRYIEPDTANLINTVTGAKLKFEEREGKVDMCKAIEDMRQESISEGIEIGRAEGVDSALLESIRNIMSGLKYSAQQAMDLLKIPAADRARYLARL
ncbi:MAG: hypothetical protein K6E30_04540 [Lachnospiraceae bacterium]|nr:hypothetical protein [Lachnospiraceae bacterium]